MSGRSIDFLSLLPSVHRGNEELEDFCGVLNEEMNQWLYLTDQLGYARRVDFIDRARAEVGLESMGISHIAPEVSTAGLKRLLRGGLAEVYKHKGTEYGLVEFIQEVLGDFVDVDIGYGDLSSGGSTVVHKGIVASFSSSPRDTLTIDYQFSSTDGDRVYEGALKEAIGGSTTDITANTSLPGTDSDVFKYSGSCLYIGLGENAEASDMRKLPLMYLDPENAAAENLLFEGYYSKADGSFVELTGFTDRTQGFKSTEFVDWTMPANWGKTAYDTGDLIHTGDTTERYYVKLKRTLRGAAYGTDDYGTSGYGGASILSTSENLIYKDWLDAQRDGWVVRLWSPSVGGNNYTIDTSGIIANTQIQATTDYSSDYDETSEDIEYAILAPTVVLNVNITNVPMSDTDLAAIEAWFEYVLVKLIPFYATVIVTVSR